MSAKRSCKDFEWMVGPLVDGELPTAEADGVEGHVRECPSCTRLIEDFRSFDRLARKLEGPPEVSASEWAGILTRIREKPAVIQFGSSRKVLEWLVPAFSLAAVLLLGIWLTFSIWTKMKTPPPKRMDAASIEAIWEKDNPDIQLKVTPEAVIINDSTNL